MEYPTAIDFFYGEFQKAGIRYILIGGFAINSYEVTRQTLDIDFLTTRDHYFLVIPRLKDAGYREFHLAETFARLNSDDPKLMDVDFMFVDPPTFNQMYREGKDVKMVGHEFRVPSINHLIALKLHAMKHNLARRWFKDVPDVLALIRRNNLDMRGPQMRGLFLKFGTEELYNQVLAGWEGRVP